MHVWLLEGEMGLGDELRALHELHEAGHITDSEFVAAKRKTIGGLDNGTQPDHVTQEVRVDERKCRYYFPGHTAHYTQGRDAANHPENRRAGTVRLLTGQGVEFESGDGERLDIFTHDPAYVARLIAEFGSRAFYYPRWDLLRFEVPTGIKLVSVSTNPEIGPCSAEG